MKHTILTLAAAALLFGACGTKQETVNEEQTNNNTTMELKNVNERVNMGAKLYVTPQPALMIATYDAEGNPDVMMAAWGGQYEGNQVCFQLSSHKTTDNLRLNKAFTLSYADARTVAESDYFGIASGRDVKDKVAHVGFHCTKSQNVNAPIIDEYPLAMECKVVEMIERGNGGPSSWAKSSTPSLTPPSSPTARSTSRSSTPWCGTALRSTTSPSPTAWAKLGTAAWR